jgi:hypothetical protein
MPRLPCIPLRIPEAIREPAITLRIITYKIITTVLTECIADQTTAGQQGSALSEFRPLVPLGEEEEGAREEGSLDESKEEAGQQSAHEVVCDAYITS